ncbi:MAG: H-NS histone family protein [Proteobacteria bacterium]|nr:H-NS histone family protein [Pseudomonadota bacterium]
MALTTLQSINAEIKQLEAQRKLVEKRDGEVPKALAVLQKYAKVLSPAQRRQVAKLIGETLDNPPARAPKSAAGSRKGRKLGKVAPKYRLPTGETWAGRGLTPKAFATWAKSAEGKAWAQANPGSKFPPASGATKAPAKATRKVAKKVRKAAKTTTRKAVKKPAKKTAKKAVKKA